MNPNKKEKNVLERALKSARALSKANRKCIKDPMKLCDECMNEWSWYTLQEEKLCNECYKEKYVKASKLE
jgi:protein-arginine kinase activator protein McsA